MGMSVTFETNEQQSHGDREALAALLQPGIAALLARGKTIALETNEELPRLVPVLCAYFSRAELADMFGERLTADMFKMHQTEMLQNLFLEHELVKILRAFHEEGIALIVMKGPALAYTVYPSPRLRTYHDIDALIRPEDLPRARTLLARMGYTFYEEYRANATDNARTGYNFIQKRPDSWLEVLIELHTAPHPSEIGTRFDVAALWRTAQPVEILGETALTMDPIHHLLYLCWHYRFHGFSRLLWLYDVVMMLRAYGPEMDWRALIETARQQELATTLYYCLSWCSRFFGAASPDDACNELRPSIARRFLIERIALPQPAKALTLASYASRRMLARRLMVDSLSALVKAAWRTLFPSRASIQRRYMQHSRLPMRLYPLYYFVHPWITLAKGGRQLVERVARRETSQ